VNLKFAGPVFYVLFTFVNLIPFKFFVIIYCSYILIFNQCNRVYVKTNHIKITMITICNSVFQDLSRKKEPLIQRLQELFSQVNI